MNPWLETLIALQPPGVALPTDSDSAWSALLHAIAQEPTRIEQRLRDLEQEVLLVSGEELLDAWEQALGLPDPCAPPIADPDLRRQRIRAKLAETGGQSRAYFVLLAAQLGLSAEVIEWLPFEVGFNGMGDPVGGSDQRLVWQMNFPGTPDQERLELVRCIVRQAAPAHTQVVFSVGGNPEHVTFYVNGQFRCDGTRRAAG